MEASKTLLATSSLDGGLIPILLDGRHYLSVMIAPLLRYIIAQVKAIAVEHSLNVDAIAKAFSEWVGHVLYYCAMDWMNHRFRKKT